ncbi:TIGR04255 family protein [Clostridium facile]|uniref:TIGR04255 family protein n=1 Tax=Clostridium facile TaxID=2763035 RepID=A0ABR7INN6_9CLOT|nr:TIGR04255 family protein [Clostridium facile]MBC5786722.1 TIGR04255 family protein [Clostridium facile]
MKIETVERKSFKHNFLNRTIMRVDFVGPFSQDMESILHDTRNYLIDNQFKDYEERIENHVGLRIDENDLIKESLPINTLEQRKISSFKHENEIYSVDMCKDFLGIVVNKYMPFEEYSKIFLNVLNIYKTKVDLFNLKRFGIRKTNFCFIKGKENINKYFSNNYFNTCDFFGDIKTLASEKKEVFSVSDYKINLLCNIENGTIKEDESTEIDVYKVSIDSDIYLDNTDIIEKTISDTNKLLEMNEMLFNIYTNLLSNEFIKLLTDSNDFLNEDIIGVI